MALWELPELGEDMGVFWWFHHQNTPIYPLYHGDSQRPFFLPISTRILALSVCPEITSEFLSAPTGQTLSIVRMERIVYSEVKNGQCLSLDPVRKIDAPKSFGQMKDLGD